MVNDKVTLKTFWNVLKLEAFAIFLLLLAVDHTIFFSQYYKYLKKNNFKNFKNTLGCLFIGDHGISGSNRIYFQNRKMQAINE